MVSSQNRGKSTIYKPLGARPRKATEYDYSQGVSEVTRLNDRGNIEVMTVKEVAGLLQVSTWMVYELVKSGELPHFKVGRSVRFIRADVVGWMVG